MWLSFSLCVALAIIVLFLPGFLILKSFRFSSISSLAAAPAVTVPGYAIFCIILSFLHIPASGLLVFGALFLFGIICFLFSLISTKNNIKLHNSILAFNKKDWLILLLYFVISSIIGIFFFVRSLDTPMSFFQDYDNIYHLNLVQSFLDSGDWSCLHASVYTLAEFNSGQTPLLSWGSYYPAAWHCLNALIADIAFFPLPLVQNSFLFIFCFIVFPLGIYLLLKELFCNNHRILYIGSIAALSFSVFPWGLLMTAPLYPNIIAFCLVPITLSLFLHLFKADLTAKQRIIQGILFTLSLLGFALVQANAVFTVALFFIPYVIYQTFTKTRNHSINHRTSKAICASFLAIALIVIIWLICFKAPFLQSVVTFVWESRADTSKAILDSIIISMGDYPAPQPHLTILLLLGIIYTLRQKKYLWLSISLLLTFSIYIVCASTDGIIKQVLAGFWYTDANRIAAMIPFSGIPLACLGLILLSEIFKSLFNSAFKSLQLKEINANFATMLIMIIFLIGNFFPCYTDSGSTTTTFGIIQERLSYINNQAKTDLIDPNERQFLQKVTKITSKEDLIINSPGDGSAFFYSIYNMNTYYRSIQNFPETDRYSGKRETENSYLIRTSLKDIATNSDVKKAVENIGAKYVLVLDSNERETRTYNSLSYDPNDWKGIDSITDETPGFTLLLEDDGMKLFKINE